jgi:uncharacterized membrane-anchored protein
MSLRTNSATAPTRVPQVTIFFWIVKILTTAAGESTSDFLSHISPILVAGVGVVGLAIALVVQFRLRRYVAWAYWFAVLMVAIFGTMLADVLHSGLKLSYLPSTIAWAVVLAIVFIVWYRSEGSLSIHSITDRRRETFYWITVIATFALGTAAGDMTATTLGWGYLKSGIMFTVAIAAVAAAHYAVRGALSAEHRHQSTNAVLGFWLAYVLTRPLGASFADWMGKPISQQGLAWGDGTVSIGLLALIVVFVAFLGVTKWDVPDAEPLLANAIGARSAA